LQVLAFATVAIYKPAKEYLQSINFTFFSR